MDAHNDDVQLIEMPRFSKENPPQGLEAAEDALEQLEYEMPHVEVQLEHRNTMDFPDDEAYEKWKRRAMGALAHMRREQKYLEKWIATAKTAAKPKAKQ